MLKFIIDTQLPPRLARFLSDKGYDAIHTSFYPNGHLFNDQYIVQIALQEARIIITKDSDFLDHFLTKGAPPQVLLLKFGNIGNVELVDYIERELSRITAYFDQAAGLVVFSRTNLIHY